MPTSRETIDYFLAQTAGAGSMRARSMFGEYALYHENKVVGLVCDDQLYIKMTPIADNYLDESYKSDGDCIDFIIESFGFEVGK